MLLNKPDAVLEKLHSLGSLSFLNDFLDPFWGKKISQSKFRFNGASDGGYRRICKIFKKVDAFKFFSYKQVQLKILYTAFSLTRVGLQTDVTL